MFALMGVISSQNVKVGSHNVGNSKQQMDIETENGQLQILKTEFTTASNIFLFLSKMNSKSD
jgi:hypothetical protein